MERFAAAGPAVEEVNIDWDLMNQSIRMLYNAVELLSFAGAAFNQANGKYTIQFYLCFLDGGIALDSQAVRCLL